VTVALTVDAFQGYDVLMYSDWHFNQPWTVVTVRFMLHMVCMSACNVGVMWLNCLNGLNWFLM